MSTDNKEGAPQQVLHIAIPTSQYTYDELADIYNQARVDYIVPMPMNARRMRQYVEDYDIDLNASAVAIDAEDKEINGIIMLGVRDDRSWITRLGVIPHRRRRHMGQFLMEHCIQHSRHMGVRLMILEVIKGNEPAIRLFHKLGFEDTRELLVVRRPPTPMTDGLMPHDHIAHIMPIETGFDTHLAQRETYASWIEETPSLLNAGQLKGYKIDLKNGESGWIIFQRTPFQLTHFVLSPDPSDILAMALIGQVHSDYPLQDTKLENLPADHITWPILQRFGYFEAFRRIEMYLYL